MAENIRAPLAIIILAVFFAGFLLPEMATAEEDRSASVLEEVTVIARRREENLQDIPDAVTVFSAGVIEDAGIGTIGDALALTPSVDIRNDQQPGVFTMTVRGVSTVRNGQPPVAFVMDGVTLPGSNAITQDLYDVERIEILKGPQGALYGRNSIGGAINIVTKQPSNEMEGKLSIRAANGDDYTFQGMLSGPIAEDTVLFRVSAFYHDKKGLLDNVTLNDEADWEETSAIRGKLLWQINENVSVDIRASYHDSEQGSTYYVPLGIAMPLGPALPLNTTTGTIQGDHPSMADVEMKDFALKVDWDTDYGSFTSISSYNDLQEINDQEIDWTGSSFLEGILLTDVEGFTQEIRFTSPAENRLRWFVGAFYQDIDRIRGTNAFINVSSFGGILDPAQKFLVPIAQEQLDQAWESYAFFGQVNYDILDNLELTLALRFDEFTADETQTIFGTAGAPLKKTFNDWQPKLSLAYSWTDDFMTYLTIARGWRPGGFGLPNLLNITEYDQETLWNYEIGFKSSLLGNRLIINGAGYYIDYSNQQFFLLTSNAGGGPVQLLINGDESEIKGVDFEIIAKPTPRLDLIAGFGLVDHELVSIGPEITTPFPLTVPGNKLPNTADHSVNLSLQYRMPVNESFNLIGRLDYSRLGKTYWTLDNVLTEGAYDLVNLRLILEWDRWKVTGFVENVFDEEYLSQVFDQRWSGFVTDVGWPSRPRLYGIEFSMEF